MKKFDQKATDKIENVKRSSAEKRPVFRGTLNPIPSHTTLEVKYRQDRRSLRLFKLSVLSKAYYNYQLFYFSKCALNRSTEYNSAESTSMQMNNIFSLETTPANFIKTQDEANNELIENYQKYESFLDNSYLDKLVVDAFCKASEHNFGTMLKTNSVAFVCQIEALLEYSLGSITKKQLQERMVDYCIFSKKNKKLNSVLLKKTIHSIEKLYTEIKSKRTLR